MVNNESFIKVYKENFQSIFNFVVWRVGDKHVAQDIVSDVFTKAYSNWEKVNLGTAKPWLYQIARNTIIDYFRKHRTNYNIDNLPNLKSDELSNDDKVIIAEEYKKISNALSKLPEKQYTAIMLKYFHEFKNVEIADILGISRKTVSSNINEGLRKLEKWIDL